MAQYDTPGLAYDSGVCYDEPLVPQPRKRMAQIKLNFRGLSDLDIIQQCSNIKTAMTGNATFTTPAPTPTLTAFGTLITTAQTKLSAADAAQQTSKLATTDKDAAIDALLAGVRQLADYVSMVAAGDAVKIQSAGFSVKAAGTPSTVPDQVANLSITAGDDAGELDLQWDPVPGTRTYQVLLATDMAFTAGVVELKAQTKSKAVATGLTSGARMFARVRATNSAGTGAWSDPATKIVP
jgi:hypothetical protein